MRNNKKLIAVLTTLVMLAALLVPMVGPAAASTTNSALTIPQITTGTAKTLGTLQMKEIDAGSIAVGQNVTLTLLNGAKLNDSTSNWQVTTTEPSANGAWIYAPTNVGGDNNTIKVVNIVAQSNTTVTINVYKMASGDRGYLRVYFINAVDVEKSGDVEVDIYAPSTGFTSGKVTVARAGAGATTTTAISTETVSSGSNKVLGTVRIAENTVGALDVNSSNPTGTNTIKLTLPTGFSWTGVSGLSATNFSGVVNIGNYDGRYAYISIAGKSTGTQPGMIQFTPIVSIDSTDAKKGDITLSVSGTNSGITSDEVIIGNYGDYAVTPSVESTPDVIAGKADQKIGNLILEETLPGSLIPNRTVRLTLQGNAKWHAAPSIEYMSGDSGLIASYIFSSDVKTLECTIKATASTSATKIKLKNATIDLGADVSGDVKITLDGTAGVPSVDAVVAKAVAPITATSESKPDVKIGLQDQLAGNIIITEAKKESMQKIGTVQVAKSATGNTITYETVVRNGDLYLEAPLGVTFAKVPKIEVTEGDLQIDVSNVRRTLSDTQLIMPIKTESSKASTIKISEVKVTLDRTVPEGDLTFKVKGLPVVETGIVFTGATTAAKVSNATCVTPAPGEMKPAGAVVFTIGDTKYKIGDKEETMDVAPYVKNSRTYLPVRYVGYALGVTPSNILWDNSNGTVTLIKGDRVIQVKMKSKVMLINGASITMDVAPEIKDGRTMLPFSWIAKALGAASPEWDETTKTVTMKQ